MTDKLDGMLNSIPIPDGLDESIELGFKKAKIQQSSKKIRRLKLFTAVAASLAIIISSVIIVGPDKVEAAIKRALQYVPGYNVLIDKEKGSVLALQEPVLYEKGDDFVEITAASKVGKHFNISVRGNYIFNKGYEVLLKDKKGNIIHTGNWSIGRGSELWQGDYYFEVDGEEEKYSLLIGDLEIPFTLEKTTEVEDFLQLGNHASDKGIDIVAVKKPMEDKLMISLLNQSEEKTVEEYSFDKSLLESVWLSEPNIEGSMYLIDSMGNKTYPTLPSSYGGLMSDFYFDTADKEGLKLVLPYVKVKYPGLKTKKVRITTPQDGEKQSIDKALAMGEFEINVVDVRRDGNELLINLKSTSPEDELLDSVRVRGSSGYGMSQNKDTGYIELSIDADDAGKRFSIYFESPTSVLLGDWNIELD
ncbi:MULTISPECIES: hypothetical protein [unclassified Sedimentibacter]|uniref:hypothetical protein n=1 Tax=unclassified Sedimentibacter TaxID=2649220 RepID=UPI0027E1328E|nr:hypothetical protein [Sedimentibacter sp. MB35-C1]WMJ76065.1 hypothetical protein RBQ61_10550 [Sedimentibacter sp. MB35-C1]